MTGICNCSSGTHFTNDFSITIQIRWKFHLALIQLLVIISRQNLAHATTAQLVPCAKYCSDHYIIIWMRAKWNFHHIWIVMEKLLVKWAPDTCRTCHIWSWYLMGKQCFLILPKWWNFDILHDPPHYVFITKYNLYSIYKCACGVVLLYFDFILAHFNSTWDIHQFSSWLLFQYLGHRAVALVPVK